MLKRTLYALLLAVVPAIGFAQNSPYFGVRLSFEVTHPAGCDDGINNGSGFTLTGIYNVPIGRSFYFEPGVGVFYNTMGIRPVELNEGLYDGSIRNFGLRVPLNVGYRIGLFENFELSAFTGPWVNINLYSKAHLQPNFEGPAPSKSTSLYDYGWHHLDLQWGFGVSATYAGQYYISINGGIGITAMSTFDNKAEKSRLRRNTISVTVGYNF